MHLGRDHFAAELQLHNDEEIAKICEALGLGIVQDAQPQQVFVQIPKKVRLLIACLPFTADKQTLIVTRVLHQRLDEDLLIDSSR